jgi:uroporphyrinogen-III synthase
VSVLLLQSRVKENKKNIVIAEIPTIEDVIVEVINYNTEESIEPSAKI